MRLSELLNEQSIGLTLQARDKESSIKELVQLLESAHGVNTRGEILSKVLQRESMMSTGIGNGIAIPHGKLPEIKELFGLFARLDEPVDFDAIDEQPVDLVFLLLAPEGAGADHLKALARVSRLLRDKSVCEKLRGADQTDAIYALLTDTAKSHAA